MSGGLRTRRRCYAPHRPDRRGHDAQQDVAHKINTLGSQVDNTAEETMAGIGAAAQKHIGDLLELHEKNMVATADIQRRKKLADDAFARRFEEVMRKHNAADYVQLGLTGPARLAGG